MDYLPENQELRFTPEQQVAFLAERASHQPGNQELSKHSGRSWSQAGVDVEVNYDEYYNDHTYKINVLGHAAIIGPEGVRVMKPVENTMELVTNPQHRLALLGGFATQLRQSMELTAAA